MFMGGFTHAGASQAVGPSSPAASWRLEPDSSYADRGMSPVVGSNGTIYLLQKKAGGTVDSARLSAISPTTHKTLWSWSGAGKPLYTIPAVASDGTVYVMMDSDEGGTQGIYAIKSGGTTLWADHNVSTSDTGPPTIGPDGTVYFEGSNAELYALNPKNGHVYWTFAGSTSTFYEGYSPTISPDGTTVYLTSNGGDLYALSAGPTGGQLEWTYPIHAEPRADIFNAPAVGPDGTIYLTTGGPDGNSPGYIDAVNPDGKLKWSYVSKGAFQTTPAVTAAGQVVAGNDVGTVVALEQSDGTLAWSYAARGYENGFFNSSAASDADGNIYIQNQLRVIALSPDGAVLWTAKHRTYVGASPALDDSGTLYVTGSVENQSEPIPPLIAYEASG